MTILTTATSEGVTLRQEIADAGSRTAAGIVDLTILALFTLLFFLTMASIAQADPSGAGRVILMGIAGGYLFVLIGYHVLFHHFAGGRTPGKMLVGIRVVSVDGYPPSFLALVLRGLVWVVEIVLWLPVPIGLYVIAFTPRRQRLGDLVAGTVVVRAQVRAAPVEPWPRETWSGLAERQLPLTTLALARLDAADVELLRELITRPTLMPEERRRLFVDVARHYAQTLELGEFQDARVFLRELYLFAREFRAASTT